MVMWVGGYVREKARIRVDVRQRVGGYLREKQNYEFM